MDRQEVRFLVLLDLSSAFDTIDHKTIIDVLEYQFGVTDRALEWIKSYLLNRKQRVDLDNNFSQDCDVKYGVPQGDCEDNSESTLAILEDCISDVRTWLLSHKLMFKDSKTEFLVIGTPQQLLKINIESVN
ncbi:Hypothetical predicted protein, partial [Paramuricea clavata]